MRSLYQRHTLHLETILARHPQTTPTSYYGCFLSYEKSLRYAFAVQQSRADRDTLV